MILRWIAPDAAGSLDSQMADTSSDTLARTGSTRPPQSKAREWAIDNLGESEFNAILEEVCDTVMPRKPAPKRPPARSVASPSSNHEVPWNTLFHKLGEETALSLSEALTQLQEIALLYPNVAPAIAAVADRLDHARRVALIAQQFTQLRGQPQQAPQDVSLRQVVSDAITQRARWLHRRKVKARLGLLDAQLRTNPQALSSLIDELINWAGGLAQDISFAVRAATDEQPHAQLLVVARVQAASLAPDQWQNVGWYLWHQLARSLGAKAELQVTQESLSVTVDFAPPATRQASLGMHDNAMHAQDTDLHSVIAGCRVLLLLGNSQLHEQAYQAVSQLGLHINVCASIQQARVLLGLLSTGAPGSAAMAWPQALVFDDHLDAAEITLLRNDIQNHLPTGTMAFVEINQHVGSDFHVSQMGDACTAHVAATAIAQSLAPALVFELCKVI